ncbi:hypothetical protein glysoja_043046 [Glycine soja]|uniref:Uncharacterized protein n=1 Tax=Glycine soja TaxID=3848 RepID=A0A0B2QRU0_GLYSO|nr:hypothetical protein glysoja_043046 [Glycine soja]
MRMTIMVIPKLDPSITGIGGHWSTEMDIHDDRSGEDNEVARGIEDASHLDGAFEEKVSEKIVINIL